MKAVKIRSKNLLNMKIVVNYLKFFVFDNEVKAMSEYKIFEFRFSIHSQMAIRL